MSEKIKVPADLEELCFLFEDSSCEHRSYLDEKVEDGFGERYITIPNAESHDGYHDIEDFIETVNDMNLKEKLNIAISGSGAFRRSKVVLNYYQKERERWFKFKDEKIKERVNEWLDDEGIEI